MGDRLTVQGATQKLAEEGVDFFTLEELRVALDIEPDEAKDLAFRMARAGTARRLKRGLYGVLEPADWGQVGFLGNWYRAAARLAEPHPYFLAYYTAMEIHRMLQHPLKTVFIATTKQRPDTLVHPVRFRFVTVAEYKFFGFEDTEVERGRMVKVADLERTFLDCVDRPELCGGLEEVFRGFYRRHEDLNLDRLLRYVLKLDHPALTKRLGFLLEVVGHGDVQLLGELEQAAGRLKRYLPLVNGEAEGGANRNKRWELTINADIPKLLRTVRT